MALAQTPERACHYSQATRPDSRPTTHFIAAAAFDGRMKMYGDPKEALRLLREIVDPPPSHDVDEEGNPKRNGVHPWLE